MPPREVTPGEQRERAKVTEPVPPPPVNGPAVQVAAVREGETVIDVVRTGADTWRLVHDAETLGTVDGYDDAVKEAERVAKARAEAADLRRQAAAIEAAAVVEPTPTR